MYNTALNLKVGFFLKLEDKQKLQNVKSKEQFS